MKKILICGRSGAGKDTFARCLNDLGLKGVCSYTTRPRRENEGDTHIFISEEEVSNYPNKIAITEINGYTYFATKEQLDEADYYIIDPNGIEYLEQKYPDLDCVIVYISLNAERRQERVRKNRGQMEAEVFKSRNASEDEQFSKFENEETRNTKYIVFNFSNDGAKRELAEKATLIVDYVKKEGN